MWKKIIIGVLCAGALTLTACGNQEEQKSDNILDWSYSGETGPEKWGGLSSDYKIADSGKEQSPIQIPKTAKVRKLDEKDVNFQPSFFEIGLRDQALSVRPTTEEKELISTIKVADATYELVDITIHMPSEHKVDGEQYDGEMQLMFKDKDDKNLIVAVFLEKGKENIALNETTEIVSKLKNKEKKQTENPISVLALLPENKEFYSYTGSFTTPPTTEGVLWWVMKNPITISEAQIKDLNQVLEDSNRPIQELNGRKISAE